jgi:hypothetical protein
MTNPSLSGRGRPCVRNCCISEFGLKLGNNGLDFYKKVCVTDTDLSTFVVG